MSILLNSAKVGATTIGLMISGFFVDSFPYLLALKAATPYGINGVMHSVALCQLANTWQVPYYVCARGPLVPIVNAQYLRIQVGTGDTDACWVLMGTFEFCI